MTKPKIILFDIDGVLIRFPYYFSIELGKMGYVNAEEHLNNYFNGEFHLLSLEGKAEMRENIGPFLEKLGWEKSVDDYLRAQFEFERKYLDEELIGLVNKFRQDGIKCYLATDQERNRAEFILKEMDFQNIFDGHFIACYVGHRKQYDGFWNHTLEKLNKEFPEIKNEEITFFDDMQKNIDQAKKFGIQAFLFTDIKNFQADLEKIGLY